MNRLASLVTLLGRTRAHALDHIGGGGSCSTGELARRLDVSPASAMATKATSGKATGRGDDVIVLGGDADTVRITHSKGRGNFVVYAYSLETGEGGLSVNEIGGYAGTRPLQAPALVQVTADGTWAITPR